MLCRIYKKNSGAGGTRPVGTPRSKEYSHDSSSPSSQYDDVLDSLPEFDDRFLQGGGEDDRKVVNLQQLGSGNFDWATLAGLNPLRPESVRAQLVHGPGNEMFAPAAVVDQVQSGTGDQRVSKSLFFPQNTAEFAQRFSESLDPFGVRYPAQIGGLGFRQ